MSQPISFAPPPSTWCDSRSTCCGPRASLRQHTFCAKLKPSRSLSIKPALISSPTDSSLASQGRVAISRARRCFRPALSRNASSFSKRSYRISHGLRSFRTVSRPRPSPGAHSLHPTGRGCGSTPRPKDRYLRRAARDAIASAFLDMMKARDQALLVMSSNLFSRRRKDIVDLAAKHRIVTLYEHPQYAEAGGLMSYGANTDDMLRGASAVYSDKILRGAKPGDLPIEQPKNPSRSRIGKRPRNFMIRGGRRSLGFALLALFVSACESTMSVEDAKKVTASFSGASFVPPPRTIIDIATLVQPDESTRRWMERQRLNAAQPSEGRDDLSLGPFYYRRALTNRRLGRFRQAAEAFSRAAELVKPGTPSNCCPWPVDLGIDLLKTRAETRGSRWRLLACDRRLQRHDRCCCRPGQ